MDYHAEFGRSMSDSINVRTKFDSDLDLTIGIMGWVMADP